MRGLGWALLGILCLVGCDGDPSSDAGMDAAVEVDAGGTDAGPDEADGGPPVCGSTTPGCLGACQIMYECVVQSSQRDQLASALLPYGFRAPDWADCSDCTARCEADASSDGDAARTCFQSQYEVAFCSGAPDPTQAANAINTCCDGRMGSTFCVDSCVAIVNSGVELLQALIPNCGAIVENALTEPTCTGSCPAIAEAIHLPVSGDADWRPYAFDVHSDGSVAMTGRFGAGAIDFGAGEHRSSGATQVVAVFDADGTPRWSRALSGGQPALAAPFGRYVRFDDAGNVTVFGELYGSLDLGAGEMTSAGRGDLLIAQWAPDGTLRWARSFGGPMAETAHGFVHQGSETLLLAEFTGTTEAGMGPHVSAGMADILVVRLDATGATVWSRAYGGRASDIPWTIAEHPSGEITIGGAAGDGLDLGEGPITSAGVQDAFLARFAVDGTLRWANVYGGTGWDLVYHSASDGEATIVAQYHAVGPVDVEGTLTGDVDQTWVRFGADGGANWVSPHVVTHPEASFALYDLRTSAGGLIEVSGVSGTPTVDFGGGAHDAYRSEDHLVGSFASDGTHRWSMRLGGPLSERASLLTRLPSGEPVLVGEMIDQIDYGPGELIGEGRDLFILRFAAD